MSEKGYYLNKDGYYWINKQYLGQRIYETTRYRKGQKSEVEAYLRELMSKIFESKRRGRRPPLAFRDCCIEYCLRNEHQKQIEHFSKMLARLDPYLGHIQAAELHQDHPAIKELKSKLISSGRKNTTINAYIEAISRVLNAAASWRYEWCDLTWIDSPPAFDKLPNDNRKPRPLSWLDQDALFGELPPHLQGELIVYVNTGLRDRELNSMRWENELDLPGGIMGFIIDAKGSTRQKDKQRLVLFNSEASAIVDGRRGENHDYVFTHEGRPKLRTNNSAFKKARARANLDVRVQDLRHTFGHRLRSAGVDEETRAELLGHGKSLTTHYSVASVEMLYRAVSKITERTTEKAVISLNDFKKR